MPGLLVGVAKDALQFLDLARVLHHVVEGPLSPEEILGRAHPVRRCQSQIPLGKTRRKYPRASKSGKGKGRHGRFAGTYSRTLPPPMTTTRS